MISRIARRAACAAILLATGGAHASTFVVSNANDSGLGSLRDFIALANSNPGPDTIDMSALAGQQMTLTTGEILISDELNIDGGTGARPTISGNALSRIFFVQADLTVSHVNFTNGRAKGGDGGDNQSGGPGGGGAGMGGAVFIDSGMVALSNCDFTTNTAQGGRGGDVDAFFGQSGSGGGGAVGDGESRNGETFAPGNGGGGGNLGSEGAGGVGGDVTPSAGSAGGSFGGGGGGGGFLFSSTSGADGGGGGFGGGGGSPGLNTFDRSPAAGGTHGGSSGDEANRGGGGGAGLGGAIFIRAGSTTLTNCSFSDNGAFRGSAGAALAAGGVNPTNGQGKGGAIYVNAGASLLYGGGAITFLSNFAEDDLGVAGDNDNLYGSSVPVDLSGAKAD